MHNACKRLIRPQARERSLWVMCERRLGKKLLDRSHGSISEALLAAVLFVVDRSAPIMPRGLHRQVQTLPPGRPFGRNQPRRLKESPVLVSARNESAITVFFHTVAEIRLRSAWACGRALCSCRIYTSARISPLGGRRDTLVEQ